jgi:hypothetical protein
VYVLHLNTTELGHLKVQNYQIILGTKPVSKESMLDQKILSGSNTVQPEFTTKYYKMKGKYSNRLGTSQKSRISKDPQIHLQSHGNSAVLAAKPD